VTTLKSFVQIDTDSPLDEMTCLQDLSLSTSTTGPELTRRSSSLLRLVLTFSERPHSVKTSLDEVLPSAIQALRSDKSEWKHFSDVPADVLKWLEGVQQSVFPKFELIELEDISKALDQTLFKSNVHGNGNLSNKKAILKMMSAQQEQLQATSGNYPNPFFVRLEASEVSIKCQKFAEPFPTDDSPRWATNRPNYYYMKLVRCHSKTCNGAQRFGMPVDPDIPYLSAKSGYCSQLLQTEARLSTVDLRPFLTQTKDTDIVVESWCIRCKERTRTSGGGNKYVDIFPRWTGGAGNFPNVEREPICFFCKKKCGQSGRFIPISESIRSIYPKRLRNFVTLFSRYNITLQRLLLEQLWPSSKEPKSAPRDR